MPVKDEDDEGYTLPEQVDELELPPPGCWYMHDPDDELDPPLLHVSHESTLLHAPSLMYKQLASLSHALRAAAAVL